MNLAVQFYNPSHQTSRKMPIDIANIHFFSIHFCLLEYSKKYHYYELYNFHKLFQYGLKSLNSIFSLFCRSTSNQIDGRMEYTFQDGDVIQPVSFLNELRLPTTTTVFPATTTSFSVTTPNFMLVLGFYFENNQKCRSHFIAKKMMCIKQKWFYLQIWFSSGHKQASVQLFISSPQ